jgi:hypothetical protein
VKIEPGTSSPAQIAFDDGDVLYEGTYTACAQVMEKLNAYFRPNKLTVTPSSLGGPVNDSGPTGSIELEELSQTIPKNVYYKPEHRNFYDMRGNGMGDEFCRRWIEHADQFPEWINGIEGANQRQEAFRKTSMTSPYSGPSNSCDARPITKPRGSK